MRSALICGIGKSKSIVNSVNNCRKAESEINIMIVNIQNKSEIKAEGNRTNGNCKPVYCITTGEIFASATDAAEAIGVTQGAISWVLTGKANTCKKKRFCYVSKIAEHLDEIAEVNRSRTSKINAYDEIIEREENIRKAKERVATLKSKIAELEMTMSDTAYDLDEAEQELKKLIG